MNCVFFRFFRSCIASKCIAIVTVVLFILVDFMLVVWYFVDCSFVRLLGVPSQSPDINAICDPIASYRS
jgi:hypothetical protein